MKGEIRGAGSVGSSSLRGCLRPAIMVPLWKGKVERAKIGWNLNQLKYLPKYIRDLPSNHPLDRLDDRASNSNI